MATSSGSRDLKHAHRKEAQGREEAGALVNTSKLVTESENNGPKLLEHRLGCAHETRVKVEGVGMTALMDTGSQISIITEGFCNERGLNILPLR